MAKVCDNCGKRPVSGNNVSYSQRKTKRCFVPNLLSKRLLINGESQRVKICAKCLRTYTKNLALVA